MFKAWFINQSIITGVQNLNKTSQRILVLTMFDCILQFDWIKHFNKGERNENRINPS